MFTTKIRSGENKHLAELIAGGIAHKGFALVDVFSPCVTYNKINTYDWYRDRVYKLDEQPDGYDPSRRDIALAKAQEWGDRIPTGVIYRELGRPTYEEQVTALKAGPLVLQPLDDRRSGYEAIKDQFV